MIGMPSTAASRGAAGEAVPKRTRATLVAGLVAGLDELELDELDDGSPARNLARAVQIEAEASELGEFELVQRARLEQASLWVFIGEPGTAARISWDVNGWAA